MIYKNLKTQLTNVLKHRFVPMFPFKYEMFRFPFPLPFKYSAAFAKRLAAFLAKY